MNWGHPPHLSVGMTVAEACLELLEGRVADAAVYDGERVVGIVTTADLARVPVGAQAGRLTLGELLAARRANALGPFGGSPCDHRPYDLKTKRETVDP